MNFFREQDKARRNTALLIVLMIVAVTSLIAMTTLALSALFHFAQLGSSSVDIAHSVNAPFDENARHFFRSDVLLWASVLVAVVVLSASVYKLSALSGGGYKVAQSLGGKLIPPNSQDLSERKILNVVEEMAIASGNPVPPVYVLEEDSINAFAAGTTRRNAVIGITRGCLNLLSREELQGVIAHEFSHIHNGDMRLNLRLVAILHGILIIGLVGNVLLRSGTYSGLSRRRNNGSGAQLGAGLALIVLGYCGVFFGNLIKAAVSRQREFLADASAVQFTRNPSGIANALKKIGGLSHHALLDTPKAQEYSHFYFGQGVLSKLGGLTATHPPLESRIRRIDKSWGGEFIQTNNPSRSAQSHPPKPAEPDTNEPVFTFEAEQAGAQAYSALAPNTASQPQAAALASAATLATAATMATATTMATAELTIAHIGNPEQTDLDAAIDTLGKIDSRLLEAARDPLGARALVYGLLLDADAKPIKAVQKSLIKSHAHRATFKEFCTLEPRLEKIPDAHKLPLLECAMPALKQQSKDQYKRFKSLMIDLIKADKKVSLIEWCVFRTITSAYENNREDGNKKLNSLQSQVNAVLAAIVYSGDNANPKNAFNAAQDTLGELKIQYMDPSQVTFQALDSALLQLCLLRPLEKPTLLKALAACIYADGKVTSKEQLMFRAIADTINCPVPLTELEASASA